MKTCEEFEIVIEKRLREAASEEEARELASHLAICVSCRGYESATRQMEAVMTDATTVARGRRFGSMVRSNPSARMRRPTVIAGLGALVLLSGLIAVWPLLLLWATLFIYLRYFGSGRDPLDLPQGAGRGLDWLGQSRTRLDRLIRFFQVTSFGLLAFLGVLGVTSFMTLHSISGAQPQSLAALDASTNLFQNARESMLLGLVVQASSVIAIFIFLRRVVISSYRIQRRALGQ